MIRSIIVSRGGRPKKVPHRLHVLTLVVLTACVGLVGCTQTDAQRLPTHPTSGTTASTSHDRPRAQTLGLLAFYPSFAEKLLSYQPIQVPLQLS